MRAWDNPVFFLSIDEIVTISHHTGMPPQPTVVTTNATAAPLLSTETVIFRVRRSILFLLVPIIVVTIIGAILFFVVGTITGLTVTFIPGLRLALIVVVLFIDILIFLDWFTTIYLLTDRRVQFRFGIIGEQTKTIALNQISDARTQIGIFGRLFNYGTVVIEAANLNSQMLFTGISSPEVRLQQINDARL